jgi:hypothetical protein
MNDQVPEFRLIAQPVNEEAINLPKFKWASDIVGTRHKIGGYPDFLQNEEFPLCTCCTKKMKFYSQIDSLNDEFIIADCGMIYTFVCFECIELKSIIQSY